MKLSNALATAVTAAILGSVSVALASPPLLSSVIGLLCWKTRRWDQWFGWLEFKAWFSLRLVPDFVVLVGVSGHFQAISGTPGGPVLRSLAIRLRFCAVAVSRNSSWAPLIPRRRKRSIFSTRFMWANSISTCLRWRRVCW